MKVINLVSKMGGMTKARVRINEGSRVLCDVESKDRVTVEHLRRTVDFFNVLDNMVIIQVKAER